MAAPLYPRGVLKTLVGHSAPGTLAQRNTVVLHITGGSTMDGAFQTFATSVSPKRVSAHFIIDRDGTVHQLLSIDDTAWHASQANYYSIGIEHVGKPGTLMCTDAQYQASAELCAWLCQQMKVPVDRAHIRTHNEASPRDGHVLCCTGGLNPDKVVSMAQALHVNP